MLISTPTVFHRDLYSRSLLDGYLSRALNVELENGRLTPIDDSAYVLTLDYTIKMLNINERWGYAPDRKIYTSTSPEHKIVSLQCCLPQVCMWDPSDYCGRDGGGEDGIGGDALKAVELLPAGAVE